MYYECMVVVVVVAVAAAINIFFPDAASLPLADSDRSSNHDPVTSSGPTGLGYIQLHFDFLHTSFNLTFKNTCFHMY